jgi:ribosomal-protein-alanine acetyltransferase
VSRPATLGDLPALVALEAALFGPDAWSRAALEAELTGEGRRCLVATDDGGEVTGYAITIRVGEVADLARIGVRPERQQQGTARTLLDEALAAARRDGAERMLLEVSATNVPALALYAAAGFTEIDRRARYYRDGSDAVVMRAGLPAEEA